MALTGTQLIASVSAWTRGGWGGCLPAQQAQPGPGTTRPRTRRGGARAGRSFDLMETRGRGARRGVHWLPVGWRGEVVAAAGQRQQRARSRTHARSLTVSICNPPPPQPTRTHAPLMGVRGRRAVTLKTKTAPGDSQTDTSSSSIATQQPT